MTIFNVALHPMPCGSNTATQPLSYIPAPTIKQDTIASLRDVTVRRQVLTGTTDLLTYFEHTSEAPCFYIKTRDSELELWGVGVTLRWVASSRDEFETLQSSLWEAIQNHPQAPDLFLLGGIGFSPSSGTPEWRDFPYAQFTLPKVLLARRGSTTTVYRYDATDTSELLEEAEVAEAIDLEVANIADGAKPLRTKLMHHIPNRAEWDTLVQDTLAAMRNNHLKKVVLARLTKIQLSSPIHPARLIRNLLAEQRPGIVPFAVAPESTSACFLGTTPELLFAATPKQIVSEALAGTGVLENLEGASSVCSPAELPHSLKNRNEHQIVVRSVADTLQEFCHEVHVPDSPSVLALTDIHHLRSPIVGVPRSAVNPLALLHTLHPTPAVCGTPTAAARVLIEEAEPFGRGWYSGAIGFINPDHSEFYVGIRSGLLTEDALYLYSGVGIVPGSIPDEEWNELTSKQRPFERCMEPKTAASE
jgi:menaquinone-specific isochorismate synthase